MSRKHADAIELAAIIGFLLLVYVAAALVEVL